MPIEPTASKAEQAALRGEQGLVTARAQENPTAEPAARADVSDREALSEVLREEYGMLASMLSSVWSASLFRVSLLLGVVSAIGVALGFAAQASPGFGATFTVFALVALPLALLLGLATFGRTVELQREAYVYITGMNRIRHAIVDAHPASRPYFVLSIYDDAPGVYRSQGTGVRLRPPRFRLVFALTQTPGIVAVICAALAGMIGWIAAAWFDADVAWVVGPLAFVAFLAALVTFWNRTFASLQAAIRPMFPTPPEAIDAPI